MQGRIQRAHSPSISFNMVTHALKQAHVGRKGCSRLEHLFKQVSWDVDHFQIIMDPSDAMWNRISYNQWTNQETRGPLAAFPQTSPTGPTGVAAIHEMAVKPCGSCTNIGNCTKQSASLLPDPLKDSKKRSPLTIP